MIQFVLSGGAVDLSDSLARTLAVAVHDGGLQTTTVRMPVVVSFAALGGLLRDPGEEVLAGGFALVLLPYLGRKPTSRSRYPPADKPRMIGWSYNAKAI